MSGKIMPYLTILVLICTFFSGTTWAENLKLENYRGGFFSIVKPVGWEIRTAGHCTLFSFYMRDRQSPLRQIFYFGSFGPVYMSRQQKQIDNNYMATGGYAIAWREMPVVNPLTPENFLVHWPSIVRTGVARQFMQPLPQLRNIQVISSQRVSNPISGNSSTGLIRAIFQKNGQVGEGLFLVSVAPFMPYNGGPGGGNAYGLMITGVTAPKGEFKALQPVLTRSVQSFNISPQYVNQCINAQQQAYAGIMRAGHTLRKASDIITRSWENRSHTYDILAEKRSDAILGYERLYDPETGDVYTFESGFYDRYKLNPNTYNKPGLKPLPDNSYKLWNTAPQKGTDHVWKE